VAALPTVGVVEGTRCFVEEDGEEAVWQYLLGEWVEDKELRFS